MKTKHLALLLLSLPAFAGEIAINCDSRVINEKACVAQLQDALKTVSCQTSGIHCLLHPWGSDFIKSWICSTESSDCSTALQASCPIGSTRMFNEVIDVCSQTRMDAFHGVCKHEHAAHSITVKNCGDAPATCAKFGGAPQQCVQIDGSADQWAASCVFPSLELAEIGPSCAELKSKCELVNSDKGVKGILLSCLSTNKKGPGGSLPKGPFDSN
jgi:hypothetical protein